ncbi:hypothetical protein GCM10025868_29310 [Angustibacter aerolatus]|uniref:Uncharacterized protein n=1 Tax=Angustibacter aerolatus TaxID=1162965 RepID=A0ABQ6JLK2_9ACTN|nr:hypothetical protein GCM10025868_29310 [Angustibacter aerolatus]
MPPSLRAADVGVDGEPADGLARVVGPLLGGRGTGAGLLGGLRALVELDLGGVVRLGGDLGGRLRLLEPGGGHGELGLDGVDLAGLAGDGVLRVVDLLLRGVHRPAGPAGVGERRRRTGGQHGRDECTRDGQGERVAGAGCRGHRAPSVRRTPDLSGRRRPRSVGAPDRQ